MNRFPQPTELPPNMEIIESGDEDSPVVWYVYVDGRRQSGGYCYSTAEAAYESTLKDAALAVARKIRDAAIAGEPRPDGTSYTYSRSQYERVCEALGIQAVPDAELGGYGDTWGDYSLYHYSAEEAMTGFLRQGRARGIAHEKATAQQAGLEALAGTDAGGDSCTREQYERACGIVDVPARTDAMCVAMVEQDLERLGAGVILAAGIPDGQADLELAYRRVTGMQVEAATGPVRTCDECGSLIAEGCGMIASLGLACNTRCYDAMADRPGRAARSRAATAPVHTSRSQPTS